MIVVGECASALELGEGETSVLQEDMSKELVTGLKALAQGVVFYQNVYLGKVMCNKISQCGSSR